LLRTPLAQLRDALGRDRTFTGALVLLGGSIGAHAITLAVMPVLTRVATPAELGGLARFISIVGVLLPIVSLRYEWAVPLASTEARAARLMELSILLVLGFAGFAAVAAVAVGPSASTGLIEDAVIGSRHAVAWVAPGIVVLGTVQILASWTIRTGSFRLYAMSRVLHSAFVGVGQVALCMLFGGQLALIIGFLGGQVLAYAFLARRAFGEMVRDAREKDAPRLADVAREYRRFPLISAPSSLVNALGVEAPILLISTFGGAQATGQLALAQRWAALPGMLIMQSLGQAFYTEAARLATTDVLLLRSRYRRVVRLLCVIGAAVFAALLAAPLYFTLVFGGQWQTAGSMAAWLGVLVFAQMSFGTVSCLEYLDRQGLNLVWNAGRLIVVSAGIVIPHMLGASDVAVVAVYSCASAIWYPVLYLMNEFSLSRAIARQETSQT
jgi:O-antigen/teichoic acid export membrane protein